MQMVRDKVGDKKLLVAENMQLTDSAAKAGQLVTEIVAIEGDRAKLMQSYLPKFRKTLPARKAARYY
jgi:hypothetical protein